MPLMLVTGNVFAKKPVTTARLRRNPTTRQIPTEINPITNPTTALLVRRTSLMVLPTIAITITATTTSPQNRPLPQLPEIPFVGGKFTVFSQFVSNGICGISGSCGSGRFCGLVVVAVIVIAIVGRTIRLVLRTRRAVVGFVIGFISVGICLVVGFLRSLAVVTGFFTKTFPVTSINGVCYTL